ncbi:MAG: hypothetical protein J3T61_12735, partial [Candidatus Brocadiales bacterium]|nr:hypothetical protein [Candidatus Bathyanammoxibius sp.]
MTPEEPIGRALSIFCGYDPDDIHSPRGTLNWEYHATRIPSLKAALAAAGLVIVSWNPSVAAQNIGNEAIDEIGRA